ncbi:MAG: hypothetical protein QF561_00620 [Phycisphaerales bacterium]|nr:hypothetical protein [Phycisphaerales bacterium]
MNTSRSTAWAVVGCGALLAAAGMAHGQAVQWAVEDGGNGHWYERTYQPSEITWHEARAIAQTRGGESVIFDTIEERMFINDHFVDNQPYCAPAGWAQRYTFWLGLYQDLDAPDYSEPNGGWYWVDGSPLDMSASCGAPYHCAFSNGGTGPEHFGVMGDGGIGWIQDEAVDADIYCVESALIEWSADCNGDGIVDYGQILDGTYADDDGNGVPDCCDAGVPCDSAAANHVLELTAWPDAGIVPHHASITPLDAMTVEYWVNSADANGSSNRRTITKRPGSGGCYTLQVNTEDDSCAAGADVYGSCASVGWGAIACGWTHLAMVVDGATGESRSYTNGVLTSTNDAGGACTIGQGGWDLRFGNTNGFSETQFLGRLDNIRIWNEPLGVDAIRHWMVTDITPEMAVDLPTLGGSWSFEAGMTDATGVNNGWLDGGAAIVEDNLVFVDCNENGVPDDADIGGGGSSDINLNGIPDECECLADFMNDDGVVGVDELLFIISAWGTDNQIADLDGDGWVDVHDLLAVLDAWGPCTP